MGSDLYDRFLTELGELQKFRRVYQELHPSLKLPESDPHVTLIVESMAVYAARTQKILDTDRRYRYQTLMWQYFPYLMRALPSLGVMRAVPTGAAAEPAVVEAGERFKVEAQESGQATIYRLLAPIRVLPLTIENVELRPGPTGGPRFALEFRSLLARSQYPVGSLRLHINHLGSYWGSRKIWSALRDKTVQVSVIYDEGAQSSAVAACPYRFELKDLQGIWNPVEAVRYRIHRPELDHFLEVELPASETAWSRFTLLFDTSVDWPSELNIARGDIHLGCGPIENQIRAYASPVSVDGTRRTYPILPPDSGSQWQLAEVRGVSRVTRRKSIPLRSGVIPGPEGTFEVRYAEEDGKTPELVVSLPSTVVDDVVLSVDADWIDTRFEKYLQQSLKFTPYDRVTSFAKWDLAGSLVGNRPGLEAQDGATFLRLLALRSAHRPDADELRTLLAAVGAYSGVFRGSALQLSEISSLIDHQSSIDALVYRLLYTGVPKERFGECVALSERVGALLRGWLPAPQVTLEVTSDAAEERHIDEDPRLGEATP
ncbi:MAG: type VI secretion system baseplate subunit TssF [Myxococcota bacterium]